MPMLKIDPNDPQAEQKELEFTIKCALQVSPEERLAKWFQWNMDMLTWFYKLHGHQTTPKIIKRT